MNVRIRRILSILAVTALCLTGLVACSSSKGSMVMQRTIYAEEMGDTMGSETQSAATTSAGTEITGSVPVQNEPDNPAGTTGGSAEVPADTTDDGVTQGTTTASTQITEETFVRLDPPAGNADANKGRRIEVSVFEQALDIVRETPSGNERLVYLKIGVPDRLGIKDIHLEIPTTNGVVTRELLQIDRGINSRYDTVWLREPVQSSYSAMAADDFGNILWEGELHVEKASQQEVIPRSTVVKPSTLPPMTLRGTNYQTQMYPWNRPFINASLETFEEEIADMADKLHINTMRMFITGDYPEQQYEGLTFLPSVLQKISQVFAIAERHDIKVLMCLYGGGLDLNNLSDSRRYIRSFVETFQYDGRVLMWDLINEPGGADGPQIEPYRTWVPAMYEFLTEVDTVHEAQVGLTWQFDQLIALGVTPPIGQYHHYSWSVALPGQTSPYPGIIADDRNVFEDICNTYEIVKTPIIIGEFGGTSSPTKNMSEEKQRAIYEGLIQGVEAACEEGIPITGVYNWCSHVYPTVQDPNEANYGVIKPDGSLSLSGQYLSESYARWKAQAKAPWE